jgi:hypothetical protein
MADDTTIRNKYVEDLVPLQFMGIKFRDSDGRLRTHYAFRNPKGRLFLLDLNQDTNNPLSRPLHVPSLENAENLKKQGIKGAAILEAPGWLEEAVGNKMAGIDPEAPEKEPKLSSEMKAAALGEDDDESDSSGS